MSTTDTYDDTDTDDGSGSGDEGGKVTIDRSHLRALEKKGQKAAQADRLARENLMLKLGVDTDSVGGKLLLDNPNLPLDKPDEIKAMAEAVGAIRKTGTPPADGGEGEGSQTKGEAQQGEAGTTGTSDQTGSDERSALGQGALGDTGENREDPRRVASDEARSAMEKGATEEDALGHYFNSLANAAAAGDARVRVR